MRVKKILLGFAIGGAIPKRDAGLGGRMPDQGVSKS